MKNLLLAILSVLAFSGLVAAQETLTVTRNADVVIPFSLQPSDSDTLLETMTFATDDCRLIEIGGSSTNCSTKVSAHGFGFKLSLLAADVDTESTLVCFEDQSGGTEAWIPTCLRLVTGPSSVSDTSAFYPAAAVNTVQIEGSDATDQLDAHGGSGGGSSGGGKW